MRTALVRIGFDDFQTEIFHILKQFDERVELTDAPTGDEDCRLTLAVERMPSRDARGEIVRVKAVLTRRPQREETPASAAADSAAAGEAQTWERIHERALDGTGEEQVRRTVKRAIGYALIQVLEDATGIEQPWGILTGVRPTKLMHQLLLRHGREAAKQILRDEYLVTEPKVRLLTDIAERQLTVMPDLMNLHKEVSIYIGIPFCPTKCAYCTFPAYDIRDNRSSVDAFLDGLRYEIAETGRWLRQAGLGITTIYFGGGTPTSISAEQLETLFAAMHEAFPGMDGVRELTVEAGRPDTITPEKLDVMKRWNVDRISINPQSFTQSTLDAIGRHHTVEETVEKFRLAREMGMNNINMDLIIGLPNEGLDAFRRTLAETAKLMPESLTIHTLSFKRASRMSQNRERYQVADRGEIREMVRLAAEWTKANGYHPYYMYRQKNILGNMENVGYALGDHDSLYNIVMMEDRQTIIGLGCGAVSKFVFPPGEDEGPDDLPRIERLPNPKDPALYNETFRDYMEKKRRMLDEVYFAETAH